MSAAIPTDETLIIETPERVPLHFALASIGNRFLACAFDHFLQIVVMFVAFLLIVWLGNTAGWYARLQDAPKWVWAMIIVMLFLVWSGYFALFEWAWNGQTPGKRWLRLRVIRED
nr:RDD family protein [Acidobacteriota bacterium]